MIHLLHIWSLGVLSSYNQIRQTKKSQNVDITLYTRYFYIFSSYLSLTFSSPSSFLPSLSLFFIFFSTIFFSLFIFFFSLIDPRFNLTKGEFVTCTFCRYYEHNSADLYGQLDVTQAWLWQNCSGTFKLLIILFL